MSRFYVTTPIYYVNDVPHLGHAYTTVVADTLARWHRLRGDDVRMLTGTDEHGQKIEEAAQAKGMDPRAFVDAASEVFERTFAKQPNELLTEPDDFIRTTSPRHVAVVQDLWRRCAAAGWIYEGEYEGLYCVGCEAYYTEKELEAAPPGSTDGPSCPIHKKPVTKVREPSYFFKLSAFQDRLLAFYDKFPGFISPDSRRNEVISFVKGGLQDLSVSRTSFKWGIPVPDQAPGSKHQHVMYVWFDALANYLSALGDPAKPDASPTLGGAPLAKYWPADLHLVGKDILRFHTIYWPAFLMAAGFTDEQLPKKVFVHGWLTINGQKMSKSLRNAVEPRKLSQTFGADVVRFYLLREVALGQDGDFSHAQLVARYNAELADNLGNLLNRTLGLCTKLRTGATTLAADPARGPLEEKLEEAAKVALAGASAGFEEVAPHRAIDSIWALARAANKYVDESAPWAEAKKGEAGAARVDAILATALEVLRWLSVLIWPAMPTVSEKLRAQLGLAAIVAPSGREGADQTTLTFGRTWDASKLSLGTPIFPKIDAERQEQIFAELGVVKAEPEPVAAKGAGGGGAKGKEPKKKEVAEPAAEITFEEFTRLDLRIGKVVSAERVPKSDKLLKLQVDLGESAPRQIVAGLGKSFEPDALVGQLVTVVANLKPAKLMGQESRGMVLAAGGESEADLVLVQPLRDRVIGTRVK
jgi:methionyl-tRNA synthetase